jgi:hypothetical protein
MIENAKQRNKLRVKKGRKMPKVIVTKEFISGLPTTCALSGVELIFCSGHVNVASLDRINDSGGYTNGNVRLVDIRFNTHAKCGPLKSIKLLLDLVGSISSKLVESLCRRQRHRSVD